MDEPARVQPEEPTSCPTCAGTGSVGPVHVYYGPGRGGGWKDKVPCHRCSGSGVASAEVIDWMRRGAACRQARINRGELLGDAADRLDIHVVALSAMEAGKRDPTKLETALANAPAPAEGG